ncbi:D-alanyl-D-alanine carboxypeptidase family protein [Schwartzia succinivorans]|uniref:D-alanyl-D-alanine carboxypeptidase family protein n=1 Tax=Schwartzia succinivorans TaxID=55507 RepID=UPI00235306E6|nr:D-alanyl-D-alanine carboxypeptidase family protein [Schwartzia succinivorans]
MTNNISGTDDFAYYVPANDVLPSVTAKSAIVIEALTGRVLYSRNADALCYPASTTKIMTLIMALEKGNLDDVTKVSVNAADTEGSTVWLEYDERVRIRDLLYGMMLVSGNDAAAAIAEHYMGSSANYAEKMTNRAHELGAVHTNFRNVSGLPDPQHYTTARDLAMLTAYGYSIPGFEDIVSSKNHMMLREREPYNRDVENENILLWIYNGANGVKTGYTDDAGRCLVSAAKRNGIQLIAVVFDSLYMWNDSIAMLNYGFQNIEPVTVVEKGSKAAAVPVRGGSKKMVDLVAEDSVVLPKCKTDRDKYDVKYDVPDSLNAGIHRGDVVGNEIILYNGKQVASVSLIASESIERKSLFRLIYSLFT